MNIDMAALHAIESERGIPEGELLETIKTALLTAYRHTEGHQAEARIDIDRKTGEVRVMAAEHDDDGRLISEFDDTPDGFGRVAATTARGLVRLEAVTKWEAMSPAWRRRRTPWLARLAPVAAP